MDFDFSWLFVKMIYLSMFGVIGLKSEGEFCGLVVDVKVG